MSARSWKFRAERFGVWFEEDAPWGSYIGIVVDSQWRWGRQHTYYNVPHDQFSVGPVHLCWSLDWCDGCWGEDGAT